MNGIRKKGFTVAEILITLTIIGIVAAFTISGVVKNYRKIVTVARLKSAYSLISKAVQTSEARNGSISSWNNASEVMHNPSADQKAHFLDNFANTYLTPYLKTTNSGRKELKDFGYKEGIFMPDNSKWVTPNQKAYGIELANGMVILVGWSYHIDTDLDEDALEEYDLTRITFVVDLDGPRHGANTRGKDFFIFEKHITSDPVLSRITMSGIFQSDYDGTGFINITYRTREELLDNCKKKGFYCGALIMTDGWNIASDYPLL